MQCLVCLHGFTGAPESWDAVADALPTNVELHRPHILGHDPGDAMASTTFEDEVDRLARLVGERGGDHHLAGYSQGGRLAVGLLVRHPGLFNSATLIGASPGLETEDERRCRRESDERLARLIEENGLERFLDHWQALPLFATQRDLPKAVLDAQQTLRLRHRPAGVARALRILGLGRMPSYWDDLTRIEVPVHLMVGEHDRKFRRIARRMSERLPRCGIEVVPSAGHNLLLEAPGRVAKSAQGGIGLG